MQAHTVLVTIWILYIAMCVAVLYLWLCPSDEATAISQQTCGQVHCSSAQVCSVVLLTCRGAVGLVPMWLLDSV